MRGPVSLLSILLVAGCAAPPRPTAAPRRPQVELATTTSDAWTRSRTLRGIARECARLDVTCASTEPGCTVSEVEREGAAFHVEIALAIGANTISVRCDGAAIESVVWTVPAVLRAELPLGAERPPERAAWISSAVVYGAPARLFAADDGGATIEARLDALRAIGIDTLWLSSIHPSPEGSHPDAVLAPLAVSEDIGGEEGLRSLIAAAHARGMRVLLDMEASHVAAEHPYFQHAERFRHQSPYYHYFLREQGGEPVRSSAWEHLPNLDYENVEVRTMMSAALAYWVRELDVDGFRIGGAWAVRQRSPELLGDLASMLYAIDPELLLIAEASARDPYWRDVGFAAAYDWTDEVGRWAWREAFARESGGEDGQPAGIDVGALRAALAIEPSITPLRSLDGQHTGALFRTRHGRAAYDAATVLLFALPGIPALLTGDERAAEHAPDDLEEPLADGEERDAAAALARPIALRREQRALREGSFALLEAEPADSVIALERRTADGEAVLVVIELGGRATTARIRTSIVPTRNLLDGQTFRARARTGLLEIPLPAYGARVLASR